MERERFTRSVKGLGGIHVEAIGLNKHINSELNLLQNISLNINERELVFLVGLSGAGKSTLADALSGERPATDGAVYLDGASLYDNTDVFRSRIGYVPQRDIIHMELTVYEALDYAARLRLPQGTSDDERETRINDVIRDLSLEARRDVKVGALSGGQQKRVSIGVELMAKPRLIFMDEPTSGLDPHTEAELMELLRWLTDYGRTIVVITHSTKHASVADQIIFMVKGGHLAWAGDPQEALTYFEAYHDADDGQPIEYDDFYGIVQNPEHGTPPEWGERFKSHPAYAKFIKEPLKFDEAQPPQRKAEPPPEPIKQASALGQLFILTQRNIKILQRDIISLLLMIVAPPIVGAMTFMLTYREMYDPLEGDASRINLSVTLVLFLAIAIGGMSFMLQIAKETDIYKRERGVNLKVEPYVLSKVLVAGLLAIYQSLVWFIFFYLAVDVPGGTETAVAIYISMFLISYTAMVMGLLASALAPNIAATPMLAAAFIIPQIMFSGALLPITQLGLAGEALTTIMPARYPFEAIVKAGGHGDDIAADACWQLPDDERRALTDADKTDCPCMGSSIFTDCNFPGIRQFYHPSVDADPPTAPEVPTVPDPDEAEAAAEYVDAMPPYLDELSAYQTELTTWQQTRSAAIGGAEGRIGIEQENFGPIFSIELRNHWLIQIMTWLFFVGAVIGVQRIKDRV